MCACMALKYSSPSLKQLLIAFASAARPAKAAIPILSSVSGQKTVMSFSLGIDTEMSCKKQSTGSVAIKLSKIEIVQRLHKTKLYLIMIRSGLYVITLSVFCVYDYVSVCMCVCVCVCMLWQLKGFASVLTGQIERAKL